MLAAEQMMKQILQKSLYYSLFNKRIFKIEVNVTVHLAEAEIVVAFLKCAL